MSFKNKIEILHEDKKLIVANKPAGLSVHPNDQQGDDLLTLLGGNLHIVNRLDKETSGVVVLARTPRVASRIQAIWNTDQVVKEYVGVTRGEWKSKKGKMSLSLSDKAEGRKNPRGQSKDRVECLTERESMQQTKYFCMTKFILHSGRQHQIRKHCAIEKHALVGDKRYGDKKYNSKIEETYGFSGQALHCHKVTITQGNIPVEFVAAIPKSFQSLFVEKKMPKPKSDG